MDEVDRLMILARRAAASGLHDGRECHNMGDVEMMTETYRSMLAFSMQPRTPFDQNLFQNLMHDRSDIDEQ